MRKLLFLGGTCIYSKVAPQPLKEESPLSGPLEPTKKWYAVAKIAGIKLCQACHRQRGCRFVSAMPANRCRPGDNFDLQTSHVLPALVRKFHEAKLTGAWLCLRGTEFAQRTSGIRRLLVAMAAPPHGCLPPHSGNARNGVSRRGRHSGKPIV